MEKTINTRILQRSGTTSEWKDKIPKANELIVYTDGKHHPRLKIGDGTTKTQGLDFIDIDAIHEGEGDSSIVINSGRATGVSSISGGTSDKSLATKIVGYDVTTIPDDTIVERLGNRGLILKERAAKPSESIADLAISFGAGNQSITALSNTIGVANQAGGRGFYIQKVVTNSADSTLSIYLCDEHKPYYRYKKILGDGYSEVNTSRKYTNCSKALSNIAVGDLVSFVLFDGYLFAGSVTEIDSTNAIIKITNNKSLTDETLVNEVTFSNIATATASMTILAPGDFTVSFPNKPQEGLIDIHFGGTSIGAGNSASGNLSFVVGFANVGGGLASFVSGRENIGAFASLVGGYKNTVSGPSSFSSGLSNTVNGEASGAIGSLNTVSGKRALAAGGSNIASGDYAFAGGLSSEATEKYAFAFGHVVKATTGSQAVVGRYNIIDTDKAFIVGTGTSSTPKNALAVSWSGDTSIHRHLNVGSNATIAGNLTVEGNTTITGSLNITGEVYKDGQVVATTGGVISYVDTTIQESVDALYSTEINYDKSYSLNENHNLDSTIVTHIDAQKGASVEYSEINIAPLKWYNMLANYQLDAADTDLGSDYVDTHGSDSAATVTHKTDGRIHVVGKKSADAGGVYYILNTFSHSSAPRCIILPPGTYAFKDCCVQYRILEYFEDDNTYQYNSTLNVLETPILNSDGTVKNYPEIDAQSEMKTRTFDCPVIIERVAIKLTNSRIDRYFAPFICIADGREQEIECRTDGVYIKGHAITAREFYSPAILRKINPSTTSWDVDFSDFWIESSPLNPVYKIAVYGKPNSTYISHQLSLTDFMLCGTASHSSKVTLETLHDKEHSKRIYCGVHTPDDSVGENGDIYIMYE